MLLAAGESLRLGRPKQLLPYKGKSLLQHVLSEITNAAASSVVVVLGASSALIREEIEKEDIHIVENQEWKEGIASSIRSGLAKSLQADPDIEAVIFAVCDQPFVTTSLINDLVARHVETGLPIVASAYENTVGTPALFNKTLFGELMQLRGDAGAKKIIQQHPGSVSLVSFPKGNIDIDTAEDYKNIK